MGIPEEQPVPVPSKAPLTWQLACQGQLSYYTSPSYLSRWDNHHPQPWEDQYSAKDLADDYLKFSLFWQLYKNLISVVSQYSQGSAFDLSPHPSFWEWGHSIMFRMVKALKIDMSVSDSRPKNKILSCLYLYNLTAVTFPVLEGLLGLTESTWERPAFVKTTPRKTENLYRIK